MEGPIYRNLDASPSPLQRVERFAQRAYALDPRLPETQLALGTVSTHTYDYASAALEFRTATDLDANSAYAWDLLSWSLGYEQAPEAEAAEKSAREALRLQPDMNPAYYHLGRALLLQRRYLEAIATFERRRELGASSSFPELGLGQVYLAQGDYDKAVAAFLKNAKPAAINYFWLGAAYSARGDKQKALACCKRHSTWDSMILPCSMPARIVPPCAQIRASGSQPRVTAGSASCARATQDSQGVSGRVKAARVAPSLRPGGIGRVNPGRTRDAALHRP